MLTDVTESRFNMDRKCQEHRHGFRQPPTSTDAAAGRPDGIVERRNEGILVYVKLTTKETLQMLV